MTLQTTLGKANWFELSKGLKNERKLGLVRKIGNFEKPGVWKTGILYCIRLFFGKKKWFMNCDPLLAL